MALAIGMGIGIPFGEILTASPGFSPLSLFAAGEQGAWYDPSDLTTMFQDSAGTTPVTAVEQPVGKILDKSGRGNHATQATSASRPTLKQDGSGLYYLSFDGADDSLATTASVNMAASDEMAVIVGLRRASATGAGIFLETSSDYAANNGTFVLYEQSGAAGFQLYGRGTADPVVTAAGIGPRTSVYTGTMDISAPLLRIRENGGSWNQSTATLGTGNLGNHVLYVGRRNNASLPFNGRLYGLIVRGAATSGADLASAESWMAARTGVTL